MNAHVPSTAGRVVIASAVLTVVAACGAGGGPAISPSSVPADPTAASPSSAPSGPTAASPSAAPAETPTPVATSLPPYKPVIDPANFTAAVTNPYFPLRPGTRYTLDGMRDAQPRHDELTVTKERKSIMGVACVVVRDVATSDTALVEKTTDWYAQDKDGNVWYFGEDTAEYTNGKVSSTAGTWLAGVDGALPGLVMKAAPKVPDAYRQEYRPGVAEDFAKIVQVDATAKTSAGTYKKVVVTEDTDLLDASKNEHKSYAPGIGLVVTDGMVNGHHEVRRLASVLAPR